MQNKQGDRVREQMRHHKGAGLGEQGGADHLTGRVSVWSEQGYGSRRWGGLHTAVGIVKFYPHKKRVRGIDWRVSGVEGDKL